MNLSNMSNSSIFKPLHSQKHLQRNVFDIGNRSLFTSRCGMLLPVFVRESNPNEAFTVRPDIFTRTQPLNTAAFSRVKQNLDFFFVPYRTIWHNFGNFYTQTDFKSRGFETYGESSSACPMLSETWATEAFHLGMVNDEQSSDYFDLFGNAVGYGAARLIDQLQYGPDSDAQFRFGIGSNPFRFLAYQKIYQDFYRNPLYEVFDPECFSLDGYEVTDFIRPHYHPKWFTIRYASWKKDYFTNNRPMFAGADFMSSANLVAPFFPTSQLASEQIAIQTPIVGSANQALIYQKLGSDNTVQLTVNNLRSAFALDKLLKLRERAKDGSYTEQIKARFGVSPRDDADSSTYLGSVDAPISIGEVVSSADTYNAETESGDSLGRIAGKGYSSARGEIKFETQEHGIIMGILSYVPEADYDCNGVSRFNTMSDAFDFFTPEFDDLGYQPTFGYELELGENMSASTVLGYNPRYAHYKTAFDEVHGAFRKGNGLSAWVAQRVPSEQQKSYASGLSTAFFKVNPQILDSIMSVFPPDSEKNKLSSEYDTFLCSADFQVTAIRPMSVYGLPNV